MYRMHAVCTSTTLSLRTTGLFSRSRVRGTRGAHVYTSEQDWVPAGLHGACSGRLKSRGAGLFGGTAFRADEANITYIPASLFIVLSLEAVHAAGFQSSVQAISLVVATAQRQPCSKVFPWWQPRHNSSHAPSSFPDGSHGQHFSLCVGMGRVSAAFHRA